MYKIGEILFEYTVEAQKRIIVARVVRDIIVEKTNSKDDLGVFTFLSDRKNTSPSCFKVHKVKYSRFANGLIPKGPEICRMTVDLEKKIVVVEPKKQAIQNMESEKLNRFGVQSQELSSTGPDAQKKLFVNLDGWIMQC